MAARNGLIPTTELATLPLAFSNQRRTEHLTTAAYASLVRMMLRATAESGSAFSVWDAYRSLDEQVAMLKKNYVRVQRPRTKTSDRVWDGSTWAKKEGRPLTASPGHSNHGGARAVDIHPAPIQAWMRSHAFRFGWANDVPSEPWHWSYLHPSRDQHRSEGLPPVAALQRVLGLDADGKPGPATAAAVRHVQTSRGLRADGIAGPATLALILGTAGTAPPPPKASPVVVAAPPRPQRMELEPALDGIFSWADSSTQFWDAAYPSATYLGGAPKGLLHSTETGTWPGYRKGASAPHLTVRFDAATRTIEARQHFSTTRPSRALVNRAGGVQTNNQPVFQIELIGSADRAFAAQHGYHHLPDLLQETWALDALAAVLAAASTSLAIPLRSSMRWVQHPTSYGETASQRLTGEQWTTYSGWLGHQHAPENTHGDPGDLPIAEILAVASGAPAAAAAPPPSAATHASLPTGRKLLTSLIGAPDFPLLRTAAHRCCYGPRSGPRESVSGHVDSPLNPGEVTGGGAAGLRQWQAQMVRRGYELTADGRYGARTAAAAENLQRLAGITRDGLIGPDTFHAAWLLPPR